MASKALRDADRIVRKDHIPADERTPARDEVADWIEEHAADDWSEWDFKRIADEEDIDYSRQHVANVVEKYFQPAGMPDQTQVGGENRESGVGDLTERELELYRRGYRDGWRDRGQPR